jgi:hypothetical protein
VIKLRILRWGDDHGLSSSAQCSLKCLYKKGAGRSVRERLEGGGRGATECKWLLEAGKRKRNGFSPRIY